MTRDTIDTREMLRQWGRWARSGAPRLGYPPMTPFRRLLGSTVPPVHIPDEEGAYVDGLVSELSARHPREAAAVVLTYLVGMSGRAAARPLRCSPKTVQDLLARGEYWIDARMTDPRG